MQVKWLSGRKINQPNCCRGLHQKIVARSKALLRICCAMRYSQRATMIAEAVSGLFLTEVRLPRLWIGRFRRMGVQRYPQMACTTPASSRGNFGFIPYRSLAED